MRLYVLAALAALHGPLAWGEARVSICHGYSCIAQAEIWYSAERLGEVRRLLAGASDAEEERARLAQAVGLLYRWAGEQSVVRNDRAGNYADGHVPGKMDCIDHSTSTTRLLAMLERAEMPISRKEIAELIGMTTENVIRILSEFKKEEIIRIEGKEIEILDFDRLQMISDRG